MGNAQCNDCKDTSLETQAYGTYEVFNESSSMLAIVEKKIEKDLRLQKTVEEKLAERQKINHAHIVKLKKYMVTEQQYGCKFTMYYEYIPKTLKDRAEELAEQGKDFSERELFAIIYGIQSALFKLNEYNIRHSCLNFETIMCKNNFYKITDVSSTTYTTSFDLASKGDREQFLSESLLEHYSHKSLNPSYELKDDLFSLGMICLALGSGKKAEDFYIWSEKNAYINTKGLGIGMKCVERKYSSRLSKKIKSLIFNPEGEDFSETNLTDSLQELDDQMSRVLSKANNKLNSTTLSPSVNQF